MISRFSTLASKLIFDLSIFDLSLTFINLIVRTYTQLGEPCGNSFCRAELGEECIAGMKKTFNLWSLTFFLSGRLCGCPKGMKRSGPDAICRVVESWSLPLVVIRDGANKLNYSPNLGNPSDSIHKVQSPIHPSLLTTDLFRILLLVSRTELLSRTTRPFSSPISSLPSSMICPCLQDSMELVLTYESTTEIIIPVMEGRSSLQFHCKLRSWSCCWTEDRVEWAHRVYHEKKQLRGQSSKINDHF